MIEVCHGLDGWFACDDADGSSTDYYPSRDALREAIAKDTAEFTGAIGDYYELRNDPAPHVPQKFVAEPQRQRVLVDGMKCLRGQLDLF